MTRETRTQRIHYATQLSARQLKHVNRFDLYKMAWVALNAVMLKSGTDPEIQEICAKLSIKAIE